MAAPITSLFDLSPPSDFSSESSDQRHRVGTLTPLTIRTRPACWLWCLAVVPLFEKGVELVLIRVNVVY